MMSTGNILHRSCWVAGILLTVLFSEPRFAESYKNYTVGDSLGWYDNLIKPGADYQKWASGKSFSLGDFLIFNTDNNHTVVQTYNLSSYKSCDYSGDDSTEWSFSDPSSTAVYPVTVPVPLLKEGPTYFFSSDYDGWQCQHGAQLEIHVSHGQGLPPSLKSGSSMAPSPSAADSGDDESVPDTVVSGDFSHPKNITSGGGDDGDGGDEEEDAKAKASSGCGFVMVGRLLFLGFFLVVLIV